MLSRVQSANISRKFKIAFPREVDMKLGKYQERHCEWFKLPDNVYDHKSYPLCKCGRKFVPINKGDKICFFCQFTDK